MGKILIFIFDEMTDYEVTLVTHLLGTSGNKEIITIAYEDKLIKGRSGFIYKPAKVVNDIINENVDGLIIPGGWNGDYRQELHELINKLNCNRKLIAGICGAGTVYLAKSGILDNVKYTTPVEEWAKKHRDVFGEDDPFPRNNFVRNRLVRDNNIITAEGSAFIDFAVEICDWFNLFEDEIEKQDFLRELNGK